MLIAGAVIATLDVLVLWLLSGFNMTKGRLLRIDGRMRLPRRRLGDGWALDVNPRLEGLSSWERAALADLWLQSARMEQASVPAFALLALELGALGAPLELVERAHHAALDELDHTRRCYALARAYSGLPWTAGSVPELAARPSRSRVLGAGASARRLAGAVLRDGCLAEGIASRVAFRAGATTTDLVLRDTLETIALDERCHAELAFGILEWCLGEGDRAVRDGLRKDVEALAERVLPRVPKVPGVSEEFLQTHGLVPQTILDEIVLEEIADVQKRVRALLAVPWSGPAVGRAA